MKKTFLPLHPAQRDVYTDQLINAGSPHYNIGGYIRLKGNLNKEKLGEAIRSIPVVFDAFKIRFFFDGTSPVCYTDPDFTRAALDELDFTSHADPKQQALDWMQQRFNTAFVLEEGNLLFENTLIKIATDEYWYFGRFHHLITDGYGFIVFVQYVAQKYRSLLAEDGQEFQYPAYLEEAVKAAEYFGSENYATDATYWKEKIKEKPKKILSGKYQHQNTKGHTSSTWILDIDPEKRKQLEELQAATKSGLQHLTIAALLIYLGKTTEESQFVFGIPIHKRNSKKLRNIVGMFSGILPFKGVFEKEQQIIDLVKQITQSQRIDYRHQDYPVGDLTREIKAKEESGGYLHEISVNYEPLNFGLDFGEDLEASIYRLANDHDLNPLQLCWREYGTDKPLQLHVHYGNQYFATAEIKLLVHRLLFIIEQFSQGLEHAAGSINILPAEERSLIENFNDTGIAYPKDKTIIDLFEEQSAKTPNAIAVSMEDEQLTYQQLNERSNQLGRYLKDKGVTAETLVPICIERSVDMIVGILGILKARGAYVPVDPDYPTERISYILEDTQSKIIISSRESRSQIPVSGAYEIIDLSEAHSAISLHAKENPRRAANPNSVAYVIYTSGSTGKPKGVLVEHLNVVRLFKTEKPLFDFNEQDVWTMFHSFTFDFSVWEMYGALFYGGRLVIVPKEVTKDATLFCGLLLNEKVTVLNQTPSSFYNLQNVLVEETASVPTRYVIFGGEALSPSKLQPWKKLYPSCRLINMYGITETTVHVTYQEIEWQHINGSASIIGRPIPTLNIYILDKEQNTVPVGVAGELYVAGAGVARGYLNREDLTKEKFINDPFSVETGSKMYRTGDLGRWLTDGTIEYLGRIDEQVKIRGYRIELGEIENTLLQSKLVKQVVVIANEDINGNKRLIGYVVANDFDKKAVTAHLKGILPEYMVPAIWVEIDTLPLTANGKIDRKALPDPDITEQLSEKYIAPQNEIQRQLSTIWKELLNVEKVGIEDNFFELGGDSIIAIQLISRLKRLGYSLQPKDIFVHQTIYNISNVISLRQGSVSLAEQGYLNGAAGLLPIQQWYFEKDPAGVSHYNQAVLLKIEKRITREMLQRAFEIIAAQHDALRFKYDRANGSWHQEYGSGIAEIIKVDFSKVPTHLLDSSISEYIDKYQRSLDIEKGDIMRFALIQTPDSEAENFLFIAIHHLAVDGVSWRILVEDLQLLLDKLSADQNAALGSKTSSYRQWYAALETYGQSQGLLSQKKYWEQAIKSYQPLTFDKLHPETIKVKDTGLHVTKLDAVQTQNLLQKAPRVYHTEINDMLLAALVNTVCKWSSRNGIVVGMEGHGREYLNDTIDISRTVGWFTSLYPLPLIIAGVDGPGDLIKTIKEQIRQVPGKGLGYGVLKYINKEPSLDGKDPWDILFNYLGQLDNVTNENALLKVATGSTGASVSEEQPVTEKLALNCHVQDGQLVLNWSFSKKHFEEETIKNIAHNYASNLRLLIDHCLSQEKSGTVYTPSDYGLGIEIRYKELDGFLKETFRNKKRSESIDGLYRLSTLQQGMLFHGLYDAGAGTYLDQLACDVTAPDLEFFSKSWNHVLKEHGILRTAFYHDEFSVPVQCVYRDVELPVKVVDYSHLKGNQQAAAIKEYEKADRVKGFDFKTPPLMRLSLLRLEEDRYHMLWTWHHVLMDGWSLQIVLEEFLSNYKLLLSGKKVGAFEEDRYEDYIRYIESIDKVNEEKYWRNYLQGVEQKTLLPFIRSTTELTKGTGASKLMFLQVPDDVTVKLQSYIQRHRLTANTIMQGVWSLLLHRYTSSNEIVFGVIVSGRPDDLARVEQRVGMYINTLPLHSRIKEDEEIIEWLQNLQQDQISSRQFQHTPLFDIQEWTGIQGDFFDSLLVFQNYPLSKLISSGEWALQVGNVQVYEQNNFPLTVTIRGTEQISVEFRYNSELLEETYVEEIRDHFEHVLQQIVENKSGTRPGDIKLLTSTEEHQLLSEYNTSKGAYPKDKSVTDLFELQAEKTPAANALMFEKTSLSYQELNERANQLAHYLRSRGVKEETLVPLCMERGLDMVVAMLAILKAGAAYVAIDTDFPADRISYMVEDSGASIAVSSSNSRSKLEDAGIAITAIDEDWIEISQHKKTNLTLSQPNQLAYVIYTSGSTGNPKGVMIEHRSLVDYVYGLEQRVPLVSECRSFALVSTIATDLGNTVIYSSLLLGGCLHVFSKEAVSDAELLQRYFKLNEIDCLKIVPSHWKALSADDQLLLPNKLLVFGGEALQAGVIESIRLSRSNCQVINHYGPTETTIGKLLHVVEKDRQYRGTVPIGKPFSNTRIYVLSKEGQPCPVGIAGQLFIAGDGIARGYVNNSSLTAEKFIQDPFSNDGSLMYSTGDLVKWLPDGNIEFIGRVDNQVKIRGYRVEPGDIESVLQQSELVSQAVVLAREDKEGNKRLVGYIIPAGGGYDREGIIAYLKDKLPEYMVPALLMELESFPLTANGKVDRKALPDPDASELLGHQYTAPRNEAEKILASIWEDLLEVEQAGIHDDFFELGGHSLLAVRLISAIRKELKVEMPISDIFDYPTIALLAAQLESQAGTSILPSVTKSLQRPEHIPLSFSQERLWFIDRLAGSVQYHLPAALRLKGKLNKDGLEHALQTVINRHEVLRTVFPEKNGQAYQHIHESNGWQLNSVDGTPYKNNPELLQQYLQQLITLPFDLSKDYMIRATLLSFDEQDHLLVVVMHHIASDAWSTSILVKDVVELYSAYEEGRSPALPALPLQYADYALWQRNYLQGEILATKLAYWKNKLQDTATLQLPTDYERPLIQNSNGAHADFMIDKELSDQVGSLCQQEGTTLFMTLLAAFKVLLHRYSGQEDICVGTSIASRQQHELEGMIGFFVNTLALRSEVTNEQSFKELLRSVKATTLEAYAHQEMPFEKVVEAVVKERDMSRSSLFQVMFVLHNTPEVPRILLGDVELAPESFEHEISKFEITFFVKETAEGLQGSVQYRSDLYNPQTIVRMIGHYQQLLRSVVKAPAQTIGNLHLLTGAEEKQLLSEYNTSKVAYPKDKSVTDLFELQAEKTPAAKAVMFEKTSLSYQELNERANQLAHYLRSRGVKEETLVPLCVERGNDMVVAMLAILKAGAAYVAIDTDFPADRISYMVEDSGASIAVSSNNSRSKLEDAGIDIIAIDEDWIEISQHKKTNLTLSQPNQLAYVIYTSGSTGNPKGVMIEHRSLVDYVYGLEQRVPVISECRSFALVSTIATDLGNTVIYSSLLLGGCLHVFSKEAVSDAELLQRYFKLNEIDCLKIVPSHWKALSADDQLLLPAKLLVFGGEALQAGVIESIRLSRSNCQVVNHYGPTETTIGKLLHVVEKDRQYRGTVPIGKPFSNTRIYVLSKEGQPCPVGIAGQLFIAGDGIARGYVNNTSLTAEKFIQDPFSNDGSLMYSTGDLVKWLPDGNIEFIGRVDNQVKIRGYRVEPGDIESVLQQSELVSQAVVLAREDKEGNKRLVGYIIPAGGEYDREGIIAYLKDKLPEYMVPALLMELESFPLTANGKVDRKALPDPDASELLGHQYTAPRNEAEKILASIWEDLLEVEQAGIHDDFFELGGHSLLAVRLISAIRKELKVEMPISDIFDYPTIALLAAQLEKQSDTIVLPLIEANPRVGNIPLSFSQERLWFIDRLEGSVQYHVPAVLRLKGILNRAALSDAIQGIIDRHEVLRTVIREHEGRPYQIVNQKGEWTLDIVDGAGYIKDDKGLKEYIDALISKPFDLAKDPMIRASLIIFGEADHLLVVTLHHIASDGWSKSVLVKELVEFYSSFEQSKAADLPALPVQYADYSIWQRRYLQGELLDKKLGYWKAKLEGVAPLQMPTDYPRPAVQTSHGATVKFTINKNLSGQLQGLSQQQGVTLFMSLVASFKILLHRYSGQEDICVGTPVAGRQQYELENLIGFFVNTLVLRSELNGETSFTQFLQQVRATTMDAYEHQEVPFEKVVDIIVNERDLSRNPVFQVMFVLRNTPELPELRLGEVTLKLEGFGHSTSMFDIVFFITETPDGLDGVIEYNTDLYREESINRLLVHYINLLESIVKRPAQKIGLIPMLTQAEEQQLLVDFNSNKAAYPKGKTILSLFEEQSLETPDAVALINGTKRLTYKSLNERANQLARYLQTKGVKEETLVPLCVERGEAMIVGMLGILKAGGAYVPIDSEYPLERISYMLQDTAASIVVCTKENRSKLQEIEIKCIVEIDGDSKEIINQSTGNLDISLQPEQIAYVIYTSGSTGKPKGVMIEHSNVYSFICWCRKEYASSNFETVYATTSICFDLSIFEIFYPLSIGKPLRILESGLDIEKFVLNDSLVLINTVPSVVDNLLRSATDLSNISVINMAGEPVPMHILQALDTQLIEVRNLYGPTEDTTYSTVYRLRKDQPILIGKPISNKNIYIVNAQQALVPVSVAGEICIAGEGLARGYLYRPELTREKFKPNPFAKDGAGIFYKTGDLGRWLPDGNIEYLSRIDTMVKIRGFRIELGEIEATMQQTGLVSQAVVLARENNDGLKSLITYYVPERKVVEEKESGLYHEQVTNWKQLYDTEYSSTNVEKENEEFDIGVWNDSFTGEPIPAMQMKEWVDDIVKVILSEDAGEVLEIGCGTGLIYYQLAGKVKKYIGTDFSRSSISQISHRINNGLRNYGVTELHVAAAHEVSLKEKVDTVLLNSIIQYFPGENYMNDVISKSISLLKDKGRIIIGDVRDYRLLRLFKSRLQLQNLHPSTNMNDFKWTVDQDVQKEEELCFSPAYFYGLQSIFPQITHVDIQWKQSEFINELTLYRYTVIIHVGIEKEIITPQWQRLQDATDKQDIINKLEQHDPLIGVKDIPNPRLRQERLVSSVLQNNLTGSVGDLLQGMIKVDIDNAAITDLTGIAQSLGYQCRMMLDEDPLLVNLLMEKDPGTKFIRNNYSENIPVSNFGNTNVPLFTNISLLLQKDIRVLLQEKLPEYMVPAEFIALSKLPLTTNGKIDRLFLSQRKEKGMASRLSYISPRTVMEQKLSAIWQELLGIGRPGIQDNFFELGGHSLMAMRVIAAIRRELNVEVNIKDIFLHPTIEAMAAHVQLQSNEALLPALEVQTRPEQIPLSFGQERLWFIDQLEGSVQYHLPSVLRLKGNLVINELEHAFQTIINRHEVLRTVILEKNGLGYQFILNENEWRLDIIDGAGYKNNFEALRQRLRELVNKPFDLSKDHLVRASLITLDEQEHVLVVTMHHIASDAWSMSVIVNEVVELYSAYVENRSFVLPKLPVQYADYAIWQRNYLQGDLLTSKLNYWKEKLEGVAPLLLPIDYPRPSVWSNRGAISRFTINKELSTALKLLSRQQESTLFMTVLAAFKVLLHRYSGQQDIVVGTSVANRTRKEMEGLIGFFVNMLALRSDVNDELSFTELLQEVKATTLAAYEHQDVPFEKVVDVVVKERDMSKNPLVQVMFIFLNTPEVPELRLGDITLSVEKSEHTKTLFDLSFYINESPDGMEGWVVYCTDLFDDETVSRMIGNFQNLLLNIVADPRQKVGAIPIITESEKQQLLVDFIDNASAYPKEKSIVDLFEEQVLKTPNSVALVFGESQLTYRELNEQSNRLAHYLRSRNLQREAMVPICIERGLDLVIGILGILKAGGAYVPLDPQYPQERINYMLNDISAQILLCSNHTKQALTGLNNVELLILDNNVSVANQSTENLEIKIQPNDLAYVIYTSGSTGKPKGVMIEHRSVVSLVKEVDYVSLTGEDILLSTGSSSFDATTFEYYGMLLNGGRLILCNEDSLLDNELLKEEITRRKVTKMWFTSSWFNQLVDTDITVFEGLEALLVGGEKLSEQHIKKLRQTYPGVKVINGYGPTENTTFSLTYIIKETEIEHSIPIGKPLNNRLAYILDSRGELVPVGVTGEICVGGPGLARGYLNNEELTQQKFVPNPFAKEPGASMYKTGDLGRWLPNGNIAYLGRVDDQVKIRGYRIELGEIETVLGQCEEVLQCVVLVKEDEQSRKKLVAYVVPKNSFDREAIIAYMNERLPEYMVPALWVELEQMPLTSNGKVDKNALPAADMNEAVTHHQYEAPRNKNEEKLVGIWQELLDIERVGIHDNFFELGGDSILAIQLVSRARNAGIEAKVADVFAYQTIAQLSALIEHGAAVVNDATAEQDQLTGTAGLLPVQQWYFETEQTDVSHFNQSVLLTIDKNITEAILRQAINQLVNQHDALRFRYYQEDGKWHQEYGSANIAINTENLSSVAGDLLAKNINELTDKYQRSLDIQKGEIIRVVWIQTPGEESTNRLFIVIHHLAVDGVSWRILLEELDRLLTGIKNNIDTSLGHKSASYRQWYETLANYGQSTALLQQVTYWQQAVKNYQPLPVDKEYHGNVKVKETGFFTARLDADKTASLLKDVPRVYHTEINDLLLCALAQTLGAWANTATIIIGLEGHGRERITDNIDINRTVGWFTTLFPLLLNTGRLIDQGEIIKTVKEQLRQVPGKGIGYGVLKYINKDESLAGKDPWDIQFNYLGQLDNVVKESEWLAVAPESTGPGRSEEQSVSEKLSVTCHIRGGQLVLNWSFSTKHFYEETIRKVSDDYLANLGALIAHCVEQGKIGSIHTPSDYGLGLDVSYDELDAFMEEDNSDNIISF